MAMVISDNSPSAGSIAWTGVVTTYKGTDYNIANDNSDKKFLWWDLDSPNELQESDALPTLTDDDYIIFLNDSGTHYLIPQKGIVRGDLIIDNTIEDNHLGELTGWINAQETWTFGADDDPTYTITVSGDKTSKYSTGMRVKLTDSGTQYFIITKVSYSSPNTTITLYGGTTYDLSGGAISNVYYSPMKAPQGFLLTEAIWSEELNDTTNRSQASPSSGTWYNLGSLSIDVPIGLWNVEYQVPAYLTEGSSNDKDMFVTLSDADNTQSDSDLTSYIKGYLNNSDISSLTYRRKQLNLDVKDTYYLNAKTSDSGTDSIAFRNAIVPCIIRAICAYL